MFGPRAFYGVALLLIISGVAGYTRDPDWKLPAGPNAARIVSPSGGQAAAPDSGGATTASGTTQVSDAARVGGPTAKPDLAADANGAAPRDQRSAFRRITATSRDSIASVEASKPNPISASGLLGGATDASGAEPANSGRGAMTAADPGASPAPGSAKAGDAPKPPPAQAGKEPVVARADMDRKAGQKVQNAKRRPPTRVIARRQPGDRRTAMAARSGGYGGFSHTHSSGACRLEMRWATVASGYQPIWVRICT
jgi:hypothetical protein